MLKIEGIHLMASSMEELHEVAAKFVISKSWYSSTPVPHYTLIHPLKLEEIAKYIRGRKG